MSFLSQFISSPFPLIRYRTEILVSIFDSSFPLFSSLLNEMSMLKKTSLTLDEIYQKPVRLDHLVKKVIPNRENEYLNGRILTLQDAFFWWGWSVVQASNIVSSRVRNSAFSLLSTWNRASFLSTMFKLVVLVLSVRVADLK